MFGQSPSNNAYFPRGMDNIQVLRGDLPNCHVFAALAALGNNREGREMLNDMIQRDGAAYLVRFPSRKNRFIRVLHSEISNRTGFIPRGGTLHDRSDWRLASRMQYNPLSENYRIVNTARTVSGDLGARVLEVAYARLQKGQYPKKYRHVPDDAILGVYLSRKKYHYDAGEVLKDLTGWPLHTISATPGIRASFAEALQSAPEKRKRVEGMLAAIADQPNHYAVTVCSRDNGSRGTRMLAPISPAEPEKFLAWHDYALLKVRQDPKERFLITLYDPDVRSNAFTENNRLTISLKEFLDNFYLIYAAIKPKNR